AERHVDSVLGDRMPVVEIPLHRAVDPDSELEASLSTDMSVPKASSETMESMFSDLRSNSFLFAG
ncbi:hypothetical protein ACQKIS_23050, partial [Pseudomonas fulva]|uniref:hypothetical protein n=1 Tax=Pseudomonas fulva TaxID=47880 RepID=UPI003CFE985C